jgi:hypothetical protein
MLMLSLFEPFDLPLIRAEYHSFNLVIDLLLFRALIDSFYLFTQNFAFKSNLAVIGHFLSECFFCCLSIIKTLELTSSAAVE